MEKRADHKTKKDLRSPHDFLNNYDVNYNSDNIKSITPEIFKKFMPFKECFTCLGPNEKSIPICHSECKWRWHQCNSKSSYIVAESKSNTGIRISKSHLVYNWINRFPFIFRFGAAIGLSIHHVNMIEEDDTPSNLIPVLSKQHNSIHGKHRYLMDRYKRLLKDNHKGNYLNTEKGIKEKNILLIEIESMRNSFQPSFNRVYEIFQCVNLCISEDSVYEPPKEWGNNVGAFEKGRL